ncbi:MAG: CRISPR-associated endonuclease Cas6 [Lewinellaceae bacterium]|nr:hypothetical protein [Saprospiraceae bacterium]MCB9330872.1 CRISPR-associated endonuclease Cas6 [Lewinellaceae bacterium]
MSKLRILSVAFDTAIKPWELRAFRSAVARKAGWEHELFHNHNNDTGGFHYRLPLIQYKQEHGCPMLVCLNEGIEELHHFFSQPDWTLDINGRSTPVRIQRLDVKQFDLSLRDQPSRYHIRNWIALNEDNYATYTRLDGMVERLYLLEKILKNQIVGLLHQIGYSPEEAVEVKLLHKKDERWVSYKGVKMLAFSLEFSCNVTLPDYLGIGKGCSSGWGVVKGLR